VLSDQPAFSASLISADAFRGKAIDASRAAKTRVAHSNGMRRCSRSESLTIGISIPRCERARGRVGKDNLLSPGAYVITIQNCRAPTSPDPFERLFENARPWSRAWRRSDVRTPTRCSSGSRTRFRARLVSPAASRVLITWVK